MIFFFCFILLTLLMAIYVIKRIVFSLPVSASWKIVLSVVMLIFSQATEIGFLISHFFPNFKTETSMIVLGFAFAFIFILFVCCILANLLAFLTGLFVPVIWIVFVAFWVSVLSIWLATKQPYVHKLSWDVGLKKEIKIVQLSELHIGSGFTEDWLESVVKKVNELTPDIVVITGDLIDGKPDNVVKSLTPLKDIKAPIYMSFGNHEYYYGIKEWLPEFEKIGIHVLQNKSVFIKDIVLGGVSIPKASHFGLTDSNVAETFKNKPQDKTRILLSHYPEVFDEAVQNKVFLQLSGHTHGGQLFFPFNLPVKYSNKGYLKGKYRKNGSWLYVSTGTGLWGGFPVRLGTLPEIVEITLK